MNKRKQEKKTMERTIEQIMGELKDVAELNKNLENEIKSKVESEETMQAKVKKLKKNAKESSDWMKIAEARINELIEILPSKFICDFN